LIIGLLSFFCGIFKLWIVRGKRGLCSCVALAAIILTTTAAMWPLPADRHLSAAPATR
jgi:hypothetical protein